MDGKVYIYIHGHPPTPSFLPIFSIYILYQLQGIPIATTSPHHRKNHPTGDLETLLQMLRLQWGLRGEDGKIDEIGASQYMCFGWDVGDMLYMYIYIYNTYSAISRPWNKSWNFNFHPVWWIFLEGGFWWWNETTTQKNERCEQSILEVWMVCRIFVVCLFFVYI